MKNLSVLILIVMFVGCNSVKQDSKTSSLECRITKIDSIDNCYVIYATRKGENLKMVSEKEKSICKNRVTVGGKYAFKTESIFVSRIRDGDTIRELTNHINIDCIIFSKTAICKEYENGIYDVFKSENLRGLCYIDKK